MPPSLLASEFNLLLSKLGNLTRFNNLQSNNIKCPKCNKCVTYPRIIKCYIVLRNACTYYTVDTVTNQATKLNKKCNKDGYGWTNKQYNQIQTNIHIVCFSNEACFYTNGVSRAHIILILKSEFPCTHAYIYKYMHMHTFLIRW